MRKILYIFIILAYSVFAQAQCEFDINGLGYFEGGTALNSWLTNTQGNGTIELATNEGYDNSQGIKVDVDVTSPWQVRMHNKASCYQDLVLDEHYNVGVWVKGTKDNVFGISLQHDGGILETQDITLSSSNEWTFYTATFTSSVTSSTGIVKLHFESVGNYFVDNITVNQVDCAGVIGGTASLDNCNTCTGGNTGKVANATCATYNITPDDSNFYYGGVVESEISNSRASFYRFNKDYATITAAGFYSNKRATGSAGITINFRTNSPSIKVLLEENITYADDLFNHDVAVFKGGIFQFVTNEFEIEIDNSNEDLADWQLTMPIYTHMEFIKLELTNGYSISPLTSVNKPKYIAIGNSITNGAGATGNSTHLTYPYLVAENQGYELVNWAIGGSKIYDGVLDNLDSGIEPELVSILWGYNDVHTVGGDDYFATTSFPYYKAILDTLCRKFPNAKIMAILPTYTKKPYNTAARNIDSLTSGELSIITNLQNTYSNLCFMYGTNYTDENGLIDDVHLNDLGHQSLASGIIKELVNCDQITSVTDEPISLPITGKSVLEVYPNPSSTVINIRSSQLGRIDIYSTYGSLIMTSKESKINIEQLNEGIYIIKQGEHSIKFNKL